MSCNARRRKMKSNTVCRSLITDKKDPRGKRAASKSSGAVFTEMPHMFQEKPQASELLTGDAKKSHVQSILERNALDEFLNMSLTSQDTFSKLNLVRVLVRQSNQQSPSDTFYDDSTNNDTLANEPMCVPVPRRPLNYMSNNLPKPVSPTELDSLEQSAFLQWRLSLADMEEKEGKIMTPFEKNIQFWRQLWRVLERSDVVFEILDARDPLFYRSIDLESYVKEIHPSKKVIILLNKSDLVPSSVRRLWAQYFYDRRIPCLFFSALEVDTPPDLEKNPNLLNDTYSTHSPSFQPESLSSTIKRPGFTDHDMYLQDLSKDGRLISTGRFLELLSYLRSHFQANDMSPLHRLNIKQCDNPTLMKTPVQSFGPISDTDQDTFPRHPSIEGNDQSHTEDKPQSRVNTCSIPYLNKEFTVGFVGYPNVGKSSIMNTLLRHKAIGISRQPGKTKHFQTFLLTSLQVTLCDCPGLVFPQIVSTRAHLFVNGVSSIDHMRGSFIPPIQLICNQVGFSLLKYYNIKLAPHEDPNFKLDAREFLSELASARHQTAGGKGGVLRLFDMAKLVLRDYCTGNIIHWKCPPGMTLSAEDLQAVNAFILTNPENHVKKDYVDKELQNLFFHPEAAEKNIITKRKARYLQKRTRGVKGTVVVA